MLSSQPAIMALVITIMVSQLQSRDRILTPLCFKLGGFLTKAYKVFFFSYVKEKIYLPKGNFEGIEKELPIFFEEFGIGI